MYVSGVFEDARCCVKGMCSQHIDVWGRNLGNKNRGVSDAEIENDLRSDVEGYG